MDKPKQKAEPSFEDLNQILAEAMRMITQVSKHLASGSTKALDSKPYSFSCQLPSSSDSSSLKADKIFENLNTERWLNTSEAAEFLRITPSSLFTLCNRGKIPYYKFGRKNRFRESDLKRLLMANPRGVLYGN